MRRAVNMAACSPPCLFGPWRGRMCCMPGHPPGAGAAQSGCVGAIVLAVHPVGAFALEHLLRTPRRVHPRMAQVLWPGVAAVAWPQVLLQQEDGTDELQQQQEQHQHQQQQQPRQQSGRGRGQQQRQRPQPRAGRPPSLSSRHHACWALSLKPLPHGSLSALVDGERLGTC